MRKITNHKSQISNGGFTLIETLIAILLLSTAIAGPLTIASKGISSSMLAKDQVGAFFLAQDAVEYVRFKRDTNKLEGIAWLANVGPCTSAAGDATCQIDSIQDTVTSCGAQPCQTLKYDSTNKFYTYASPNGSSIAETPERYIRTIKIVTPVGTNTDEASLEVKVEWRGQNGITRNVVVRENLFDW